MCTVVVHVPEQRGEPTRVMAVRDEDPQRPWRRLGEHWSGTHPGVIGVQDVRAGGAWLAALPAAGRLAVLLNVGGPSPQPGLSSRGEVVLDAVQGAAPDPDRRTQPYALVTIEGPRVTLTLSDGQAVTSRELEPGVHMLVNSELPNDESFTRVKQWLPEFRRATHHPDDKSWFQPWLQVIEHSADLAPTDDAAIIRDNRPWGIPTQSLMLCVASINSDAVDVEDVEFEQPGRWNTRSNWGH